MEKEPKNIPEINSEEIANLEDRINRVPFSKRINELKVTVEYDNTSQFFSYYLACPKNKFDNIISYIAKELEIDEKNIIDIQIDHLTMSIKSEVGKKEKYIKALKGKILVIAKGFEGLVNNWIQKKVDPATLSRVGHDYDQSIKEYDQEEMKKIFEEKKVIFITHIGNRLGKELYEKSVATAADSKHKRGIIEIK